MAKKRKARSSFRVYDPHYFTPAGPVTVTRADGTVDVQQPLENSAFQRVVKVRGNVSEKMKAKIMRRDYGACRYCYSTVGPFHVDHVVPIALGGSNEFKNLVLACDSCNLRKGASVWTPKPPLPRREAKGSSETVRQDAVESDFVPLNRRNAVTDDQGRLVTPGWDRHGDIPRGDRQNTGAT